ncbi:Chondramide synthase cmdD [Streptomyces sp. S4.7]|uniref:non-ribosomal peptide synthetase n=1 Tax=Streptomyces sp. S4.7 TaxID=2705439 RepID=UPI0013993CBA|nr:non-ribosomal peptide synthetase [Streptomyces sp. S4.7]QHY99222.1 Chondramide synthase cmdD [Streptomyces sp. S4.7]
MPRTAWGANESVPQPSTEHIANTTFPVLFESQVSRTAREPALATPELTLSYAELNERANRLARYLIALGAGPERLVAIMLPRSAELVTAVLAISKTGAAYLPIDPEYPPERIAFMISDSVPVLILTGTALAHLVTTAQHGTGPEPVLLDDPTVEDTLGGIPGHDVLDTERISPLDPRNPAYTIYTSGSTGRPKAVVVTHTGIGALAATQRTEFGVGSGSRMIQFVSPSFDVAFLELCTLLAGGTLVIVPSDQLLRGDTFRDHQITHAMIPPTLLASLDPADLASVRYLMVGGEACPAPLATVWCAGREMRNSYGPTESTVTATLSQPVVHDRVPPIGRPIDGTRVHILDELMQPVPDGTEGELYIAGVALARGYLNRPGLTAGRFVASPFDGPGERMYRTGDLVRRNADGEIEFAGRVDDQVKLRGFRVELGEVEAVLGRHPAVRQVAAAIREDHRGHPRMAAYVVLAEGTRTDGGQAVVDTWRTVYDSLDQDRGPSAFGTDFSGWNSSYDGRPIPLPEMREWRDRTVERIRRPGPGRVLEIGVGNGLILSELAPHTTSYWGTDLSGETVDSLRRQVDRMPDLAGRVELRARPATDVEGLPRNHFDTVVINSVIQYFPDGDYLLRVLRAALDLLVPGGTVFLGDVRNLRLLRHLHTGIQLSRPVADDAEPEELWRAVERTAAAERELLVDPELFAVLPSYLSDVSHAEVQLKRGHAHNELTRHRYDVVIHKGPAPEAGTVEPHRMHRPEGLDAIASLLRDAQPEAARLSDMPNARLAGEAAAVRALENGSPVADIHHALTRPDPTAVDPEELALLGADLGYEVDLTWSATAADRFDAVLTRPGVRTAVSPATAPQPPGIGAGAEGPPQPVSSLTNDPAEVHGRVDLTGTLRGHAQEFLPDHMVPATFTFLEELPTTPSGKLDRRMLPSPEHHAPASSGSLPRSHKEAIICTAFGDVLQIGGVGPDDSFIRLGGDSILAIQLAARIRQMGLNTEPSSVIRLRTPAALAEAATFVEAPVHEDDGTGDIDPTPIAWWLAEQAGLTDGFSQSVVLRAPADLEEQGLVTIVGSLLDTHDALRLRLDRARWSLHVQPRGSVTAAERVTRVDARRVPETELSRFIPRHVAAARERLDPGTATMVEVVWFDTGPTRAGRLAIVVHHLAVDGVSWRILFDDLVRAWSHVGGGGAPELDPVPTSLRRWGRLLRERAAEPVQENELLVWTSVLGRHATGIATAPLDPVRDSVRESGILTRRLPSDVARPLLGKVPGKFNCGVNDILLTALALSVPRIFGTGGDALRLELEGHGREDLFPGVDLSRTVGWFTSAFPVVLAPPPVDEADVSRGGMDLGRAIKEIKEQLRAVPGNGIGYGMLRYLNSRTAGELARYPAPQMRFNYMGRFPAGGTADWSLVPAGEAFTDDIAPEAPLTHAIQIDAVTWDLPTGPEFSTTWRWAPGVVDTELVRAACDTWLDLLRACTRHAERPDAGGLTPSDLALGSLTQAEIDELEMDIWTEED